MEPIRIAIKAIKRLTGYFVIRPLQRYNIEERAFKKLERQSEEIKPAPKHRTTQELLEQIQRGLWLRLIIANLLSIFFFLLLSSFFFFFLLLLSSFFFFFLLLSSSFFLLSSFFFFFLLLSSSSFFFFLFLLLAEHPEILEDIKKEPEELLQRLTEVKVHSKGVDPDFKKKGSKLPEVTRARPGVETTVASKGKVTMKSYCEMLSSRHHNPFLYTPKYFADKYDVDIEHVKDLLDHFRSFQVYSPSEIPKSRVPWWRPKDVQDFLFHGYAPYHYAQIDAEEKEVEEGRRLIEETRRKELQRQKLEAAEWNARIGDGGSNGRIGVEGTGVEGTSVEGTGVEGTGVESGQSNLELGEKPVDVKLVKMKLKPRIKNSYRRSIFNFTSFVNHTARLIVDGFSRNFAQMFLKYLATLPVNFIKICGLMKKLREIAYKQPEVPKHELHTGNPVGVSKVASRRLITSFYSRQNFSKLSVVAAKG